VGLTESWQVGQDRRNPPHEPFHWWTQLAAASAVTLFPVVGITYQVQWAGEVTGNQWVNFGDPVAGSNEQKVVYATAATRIINANLRKK
jgi:hypothetical protein